MDLDPGKLAEHVNDATAFELPFHIELELPKVLGLQITKFMVLEVVAAMLMVLIFVPLSRRLAGGKLPKGRLWNLFDAIIVFLRNEVARPAIGRRDADRFLPLIFTLFFFILFCNLLGLIPCLGSPTASINATLPLAAITFLAGTLSGMKKFGTLGFWTGLCPHMELPSVMKVFLVPMILALEIVGLVIRHTILGVRLLANMFGGHLALAMILGFIPAMAHSLLWYGVTPLALFGGTALSLLELFVAFLQAYIFTFLGALFIGMSQHQH